MSQKETFFLPDGRKTSDLKVTELKKELDKLGKSKSGNKSELLNRLNESFNSKSETNSQIEKENSVSSESQNELNEENNQICLNDNQEEIDDNNENDRRVVNIKKSSNLEVDLDASDEMVTDNVNQSVDALDLYVPIDDSLNVADESIQEERIQVTISVNEDESEVDRDGRERRVVEKRGSSDRRVICENKDSGQEEPMEEKCVGEEVEVTKEAKELENEGDEIENIDLVTQIEMYEVDNIEMELYEDHKEEDEVKPNEETSKPDERNGENADETEEGEVVTVPITARLGKRKVKEDVKSHSSPKKSKKKGLKETKGAGYIVEGPERIQPAQKSKNASSDVLRIDNLVRPFTLVQLQDMLVSQGVVVDVWLNKIKSIAYVKYESESVAANAREHIDGCRWPSINPKLLSCDFAGAKEMDWMKEKGDSGAHPPHSVKHSEVPPSRQVVAAPTATGVPVTTATAADGEWRHVDKPKVPSTTNTTGTRDTHRSGLDRSDRTDKPDDGKKRVKERDALPTGETGRRRRSPNQPDHRRRHDSPQKERPRDRERERDRDHARLRDREREQDRPKQKVVPASAPPPPPPAAKLLEDIFRKTVTQPAIYWLPVSKEKDDGIKKEKEPVRVL